MTYTLTNDQKKFVENCGERQKTIFVPKFIKDYIYNTRTYSESQQRFILKSCAEYLEKLKFIEIFIEDYRKSLSLCVPLPEAKLVIPFHKNNVFQKNIKCLSDLIFKTNDTSCIRYYESQKDCNEDELELINEILLGFFNISNNLYDYFKEKDIDSLYPDDNNMYLAAERLKNISEKIIEKGYNVPFQDFIPLMLIHQINAEL